MTLPDAIDRFIMFLATERGLSLNYQLSVRQSLEESGAIFQRTLDTEVFLHLVALAATDDVETALTEAARTGTGGYSRVVLGRGEVRGMGDPHGLRAVCVGGVGDG